MKSLITNKQKINARILDEILGRESFNESIMCTYIRKTKIFCSMIKYILSFHFSHFLPLVAF